MNQDPSDEVSTKFANLKVDSSPKLAEHHAESEVAETIDLGDTSEATGPATYSPNQDNSPANGASVVSDEKTPPKRKKSVGFAPEPVEDLKEHHQYLKNKNEQNLQSNPFWKIPPELSYLQKKAEGPKPLQLAVKPKAAKKKNINLDDMRDLPTRAVKEVSVVNRNTSINFFYHEIEIPVGPDRILVDVKYVSLSSFDLTKPYLYPVNMSDVRIGLGYDYVGEVVGVGSKYKGSEVFKVGTKVFGVTSPVARKGSLQTLVIVNPNDIVIPLTGDDIERIDKIDVSAFLATAAFAIDDSPANSGASSASSELFSDNEQAETTEVAGNTKNLDSADGSSADGGPLGQPQETPAAPETRSSKATSKTTRKDPYAITEAPPALAKYATFAASYCRAKQALQNVEPLFRKQKSATIIVNGGDTELGRTIVQVVASLAYSFLEKFNVILVVLEEKKTETEKFASRFSRGASKVQVVTFDLRNEDLILPGERVPINYKKPAFFASEIIDALVAGIDMASNVDKATFLDAKADLFVDVVGSKKMFQKDVDFLVLDGASFPFTQRLSPGLTATSVIGRSKGPLFLRVLKPKPTGSAFVSFCKFTLSEPSYKVDKLANTSSGLLNPWALKWGASLANLALSYNYYEKFAFETKEEWVLEAKELVLKNELKVRIDHVVDWRSNFRHYADGLKDHDGHVLFRIEEF